MSNPSSLIRVYRTILKSSRIPQTRSLVTALHPSPLPSFLPFSFSVPIATSSSVTLDHLNQLERLFSPPPDPLVQSLSFASDEELFKAIVGPSSSRPKSREWENAIDAQTAYLALRSRPTFPLYLKHMPAKVYDRLRSHTPDHSSQFEKSLSNNVTKTNKLFGQNPNNVNVIQVYHTFASDLMLMHPDPRILHSILELDLGRPPAPFYPPDPAIDPAPQLFPRRRSRLDQTEMLLPSTVAAIYQHIHRYLSASLLPKLSRQANLGISKSLISVSYPLSLPSSTLPINHSTFQKRNSKMLAGIMTDLYITSPVWDAEAAWVVLRIMLHLSRTDLEPAIKMVRRLLDDGRVSSAAFGKTAKDHPEAGRLLVQTMTLRLCLRWGYLARARNVAGEVLETLEKSHWTQGTWEVLEETMRTMLVGQTKGYEEEWIGRMLGRMRKLKDAPNVDGLIRMFLERVEDEKLAERYLDLSGDPNVASSQTLMRDALEMEDIMSNEEGMSTIKSQVESTTDESGERKLQGQVKNVKERNVEISPKHLIRLLSHLPHGLSTERRTLLRKVVRNNINEISYLLMNDEKMISKVADACYRLKCPDVARVLRGR
ncbi:hypothetical protein M231_00311 [Tremella mesenterica]|uniref:Uncharacterized protein n=1 Tax=Tremella mesenterica TaxID=5217 RepID=A0A4Q1BVZ5_TREME|nr:hypothetical protein M231_00311 [Tremella mesenterica]